MHSAWHRLHFKSGSKPGNDTAENLPDRDQFFPDRNLAASHFPILSACRTGEGVWEGKPAHTDELQAFGAADRDSGRIGGVRQAASAWHQTS